MDNIKQYKAYENQSWLDISNTLYGTSAYAFQLAKENHSSITTEVKAGELIYYPSDIQENKLVLLSMRSYKSIPATAISQNREEIIAVQGIGYWAVQTDFIIS